MQGAHGTSMNKPPLFDGNDYQYWKFRMQIFTTSLDSDIWYIIENGPFKITKVEDGETVEKPRSEWTEADKRRYELNHKAINAIVCAVSADEFKKLSRCETAKEMWDKLKDTYEGTSDMKNAKIDMLMHEYETFKMKENETVEEMFERFGKITNALDALGERLAQAKLVRKILRSLSSIWKAKVTALQESSKVQNMTIDSLRGNLITYETTHLQDEIKSMKKSKGIALKAVNHDDNDEDGDSDDDEEDIALLARKFRKMGMFKKKLFNKKMSSGKPFQNWKEDYKKKEEVTCFECKRPRHIRPECPLLKRRFQEKKKAMMAESTWDDDDELLAEEDNEELANLCLMVKTDEEKEVTKDIYADLNIDEVIEESVKILEKYYDLKDKYKHLRIEYAELENKFIKKETALKEEIEILKDDCAEKEKLLQDSVDYTREDNMRINYLDKDNARLTRENEALKKDLENFVGSSRKLDMMLGSQKCYYDKAGLGYGNGSKGKEAINSKPSSSKKKSIAFIRQKCYKCRNKGHHAGDCDITGETCKAKNPFQRIKMMWVVKGSNAGSSTNNVRTQ